MDTETSQLILNRLESIVASVKAIGDQITELRKQPATMPDREFLTVAEAANYLNVSKQTIYRMKHLHVKRGRSIRLRRSTLDRGFREDPRKANQMRSRER